MKRFFVFALFILSLFSFAVYAQNVQEFYWENSVRISEGDSRFPKTATNGNDSYIFWQEIDTQNRRVWLSCQYMDMSDEWYTNKRCIGPFSYSGEAPDLYSVAVSPNGTVAVAVLSSVNKISIFVSNDKCRSFLREDLPEQSNPLVAPRIYVTKNSGFRIFASLGANEAFTLQTSSSTDGRVWSSFSEFSPSRGMTNPFIPFLIADATGDTVVFQSQLQSNMRFSYQLYLTRSTDNGNTWSAAELLTDSSSLLADDTRTYTNYNNQQPYLAMNGNDLYISWERTYYSSERSAVYLARINQDGIVPGSVEVISNQGIASRAVIFSYGGKLCAVWFDTRSGTEAVYFAQKIGYLWETNTLSTGRRSNLFAAPVLTHAGKNLFFIWQENISSNTSIHRLDPDLTVELPRITAVSFTEGRRSTAELVRMRVRIPADSSGIAGFSWIWTNDKNEQPPEHLMELSSDMTLSCSAAGDGEWYLKVRAMDYAGNWSPVATMTYHRDLTPPLMPVITELPKDKYGFVQSNTFSVNWMPNSMDDDIAGYTWNLEYALPIDSRIEDRESHHITISDERVGDIVADILTNGEKYLEKAARPPLRLQSSIPEASYTNRRNGLYVFSVAAIDTVGNVGSAAKVLFILNKYIPYTYISSVNMSRALFGDVTLSVTGGGFTYDGTISSIYLDRDGEEPYDMVLEYDRGEYKVVSDNVISDIAVGRELARGKYRIGLLHPARGLYMSAPIFTIEENGTVKIEQQFDFVPSWTAAQIAELWHLQVGDILLWSVFALALFIMIIAVRGIIQTAQLTYMARMEARALITGAVMPQEKKKRAVALRMKGASLRVKMVGYTVVLVAAIVALVAVPLGYNMTRTQERTLSEGLEQRVNVLLEGLSSGVRAYMPAQNILELSYLPNRSSALSEAEFVTITGYPSDGSNANLTHVWATNDSDVLEKIDTSALTAGISNLIDPVAIEIAERCASLNSEAVNIGGEIASNIASLNAEGARLALNTDAASVARLNELAVITTQLASRFDTAMGEIAVRGRGSIPQFDSGSLNRKNTEYTFYHPVMYRQGSSQEYVRAIILIKVTTEDLIQSVDRARRLIMLTAIIIAIIAIAIGAIGSLILATVIVNPLRKLTAHVTEIGQTRNKEKLAGREIEIRSHDEIGQLGETVNEMTRDLVKAALDEKLLMDGKVVQQTFLPLASDAGGNKQTVAELKESKVECFGYYEGASGVSGDYFDYKKLDERWYVIIKCDASGHGVPAALIMTIVATLFRKYFENWSFKKKGTHIDELIVQINDFIESLGMKGKFAAIIVCLFDTETGDTYMCNAGDNVVHIYDGAKGAEKVVVLSETPAAGPLPSFMVDVRGGFKVEKVNIAHGDVLFLYTDGFEEATRKFRDGDCNVIKCMEDGLTEGETHGNHKVGEESEQMNPDRVQEILESVFAKRVYTLQKFHNPVPDEELVFDFTDCEGTISEAITALASVEKVFRMYKSPEFTLQDTVRVDKRIDDFLQKHFNRYDFYCSTRQEIEGESNYIEYTNLREDEQLDDLTILAVRRV